MSEEITKILTYLNNQNWYVFEDDYNEPEINHKILEEEEVKILLDYITNLQQENQQLKDVNSFSKRELYKINKDRLEANLKLVEENRQLKAEKAILQNKLEKCIPASEGAEIVRRKNARIKQYKSVLEEIREYIKFELSRVNDKEHLLSTTKGLLQILDKVKE